MSATPQRETYPLVSANDILVMVFRDHLPTDKRPTLFVKALKDSEIRVDSSYWLDLRPGLKVFDYTAGAGDDVTIALNGVTTTLTEGVDFDAVVSNERTALNIATAINGASIAVSAVAEGAAVLVEAGFGVRSLVFGTSDAAAWSNVGQSEWGTVTTLVAGQTVSVLLPTGGAFDPLDKVSVLNVLSGAVSADVRSLVEVRTYFKMPGTAYGRTSLNATTGHSGGWPGSPNPPV